MPHSFICEHRGGASFPPSTVMHHLSWQLLLFLSILVRREVVSRTGRVLSRYTFKDSYNINGQNPDASTGFGPKIDFVPWLQGQQGFAIFSIGCLRWI